MKKYFIMAIAAITTLTFVSCEPKETPETGDAKVVLNEHELTLSIGGQAKLRAALSPAKDGVTITYKSDNEAIATVTNAGLIDGIDAGTVNIIASAPGYKADTCVVTVVDATELFAWGGIGLFGEQTDSVGTEYQHWDEEDQCYYLCQNFMGTFYVWGPDIIFTNGVGFSGASYMTSIKAPVAIIQEGDWKGYYYMPTLLFTDTIDATAEGACAPGSLTDANAWGSYLFDTTFVGDNSFTGTPIHYNDWDNEDNDIMFIGFIKDGLLTGNTSAAYYKMNITWFDMSMGYYGLKLEQNAEGKWQFVEPYEFCDRIEKYYELLPQSSSSRKIEPMRLNNQEQVRALKSLPTQRLHIAK